MTRLNNARDVLLQLRCQTSLRRDIEVDLYTDSGRFTNAGAAVCFYGLFDFFGS